jgi:hypothetical protein
MLLRIEAPHFVAGIVAENYVVRQAAPILRYMVGWRTLRVWDYCRKKNWSVTCLE